MVNIKEILEGIYENLDLRRTIVPLFMGDPGISKSVQIRDFAKEKGVTLVPFITSQRNPFEVSGLAMPNRKTERMEFWDFDTLLDMKDGDILFFDEIFNGNPTVLNACLTILEEREMISGKKLPDIMIVAAANPQGMVPLTPQIKERFIWYNFEFPREDWKEYMFKRYKMPNIISNKLCVLIQEEKFNGKSNYYSARSIDKAVNMLINEVPTPYEDALVPILNGLIENKLSEPVQIIEGKSLAPGEAIPWLEMIKLSKGIKIERGIDELEEDVRSTHIIYLIDAGSSKLQTIKLIKELTGLGLREAKEVTASAPGSVIKENISKKEADKIKRELKKVGASTTIKTVKLL